MVSNWMVWAIQLATMVKSSVTKCHSVTKLLYHLNSKLLVCYSRHGLNSEPFNEQTVLDHLNTKLVYYSDPHCSPVISSPTLDGWPLMFETTVSGWTATKESRIWRRSHLGTRFRYSKDLINAKIWIQWGIWNSTIWNLKTFEVQLFEGQISNGSVFKRSSFRNGYSYSTNHLKPVRSKSRGFFRISNGLWQNGGLISNG